MARNRFTERLGKLLNSNPFKNFFKINRLRPPGAVDEKSFMELCIRCSRCIEVCPYDSIHRADLYEKLQIGTPYIFVDSKACYLCMRCPEVCPTGALNPELKDGRKVAIGIAFINQETCLNFHYYKDEMEGRSITGTAQLCATCYNVCPYTDEAIILDKFILPVVTEKCTGCGICVEKCPNSPEKSIAIVPTGMEMEKEAGFYNRKIKLHGEQKMIEEVKHKDELLKVKQKISSFGVEPDFRYNFEIEDDRDEWEDQ